ncbi:hypothetical protein HJFPF1_09400 [Paramyrothecium foliicola]|nr:hypothetical protein HJFPF1_09400 [Paramyrothecium foliicola]
MLENTYSQSSVLGADLLFLITGPHFHYRITRESYRGQPPTRPDSQKPDVLVTRAIQNAPVAPGQRPTVLNREILLIECKAAGHIASHGWKTVMEEAVTRLNDAHPTRALFVLLAVGMFWLPFAWEPQNSNSRSLQILGDKGGPRTLNSRIYTVPVNVLPGPRHVTGQLINTCQAYNLSFWAVNQVRGIVHLADMQLLESFFIVVRGGQYQGWNPFDWCTFHPGFWTQLPELGEFLLVLNILPTGGKKQSCNSKDMPRAKMWFLRIYRNNAFGQGQGPCFTLLSSISFIPDEITELKDKPFRFHPHLPLLAFTSGPTAWNERKDQEIGVSILKFSELEGEAKSFANLSFVRNYKGSNEPHLMPNLMHPTFQQQSRRARTVLWNFDKKGSAPIAVGSLMRDISFSNDGTAVYGTMAKSKVMIKVPFDKLDFHIEPSGIATTTPGHVFVPRGENRENSLALSSKAAILALAETPMRSSRIASFLDVMNEGGLLRANSFSLKSMEQLYFEHFMAMK